MNPDQIAESVCPAGPDGVHYFFSDDECAYCHKLDQIADTVRRPWDDTNDPKPTVWGDDGHVTPEFVEWSMRSARRRMKHLGLDPPDGAWIERFKDEVLDALNEADQSDGQAGDYGVNSSQNEGTT